MKFCSQLMYTDAYGSGGQFTFNLLSVLFFVGLFFRKVRQHSIHSKFLYFLVLEKNCFHFHNKGI